MTGQPPEGVSVGFRISAFTGTTPVIGEQGFLVGSPGQVLLEYGTVADSEDPSMVSMVMDGESAIVLGKRMIREGFRAKTLGAAERRSKD